MSESDSVEREQIRQIRRLHFLQNRAMLLTMKDWEEALVPYCQHVTDENDSLRMVLMDIRSWIARLEGRE